MATKLVFTDSSQPKIQPEADEFSFGGVTTDELSRDAMGGTEMMKYGLYGNQRTYILNHNMLIKHLVI